MGSFCNGNCIYSNTEKESEAYEIDNSRIAEEENKSNITSTDIVSKKKKEVNLNDESKEEIKRRNTFTKINENDNEAFKKKLSNKIAYY